MMTPDPQRWATRRAELKPFEDRDIAYYLELCASLDSGRAFRFGGASIPPPARQSAVWDSVLVHLVGVGRESRRRLGVVSLTSADMRNGTVYLSAIADTSVTGTGRMVEVVALAMEYAFETWPWRKVYLEVPEYNLGSFRSAIGRYFEVEGTLREHVYLDGRYWDAHVLTMTRARWAERGEPLMSRLRAPRSS